jgi:hypothetical protein
MSYGGTKATRLLLLVDAIRHSQTNQMARMRDLKKY